VRTRWLLTSDDPLDFAAELFALLHAGKQAVIPPNTRRERWMPSRGLRRGMRRR
jgi:hypothetical protein